MCQVDGVDSEVDMPSSIIHRKEGEDNSKDTVEGKGKKLLQTGDRMYSVSRWLKEITIMNKK